jgi:hypothetical protein
VTAPPWADADWRRQAIAAIGEGFCPQGHGPLSPDRPAGMIFVSWHNEPIEDGGWCGGCRIWWRAQQDDEGLHVVANYPRPTPAIPPYSISTKSAPTLPYDAETVAPLKPGLVAGTWVRNA